MRSRAPIAQLLNPKIYSLYNFKEGAAMEYTHKPVEELTFTDDFMFGTVMKIKYKNLRPAGAVPQAATGASASERGGRA